MKRIIRRCMLSAPLAALVAGCATTGQRAQAESGLVLDHVTVVDVRDGGLMPDRAILIRDGRIERIAAAGSIPAGNARVVDARGRYVVPGYNDMHSHNINSASPETSLPLMLANGVTGFRQMVGSAEQLAARAAGDPLVPAEGPALLALPGPVLAGPAVATPDAIKAEIRRQKAAGADFIKVVDAPHDAFLAGADEAEALGLAYAGHMPATVTPHEAIRHGMDAIEHMGPTISLLLSCSTDEAPIRAMMAKAPPADDHHIDFGRDAASLARLTANPVLLTPPQGYALIKRVLATYDEARCKALATELANSQTWVMPTLTRLEAMYLGNDPSLRDNPALRYVPQRSRVLWREVGEDFDAKVSPDQRKTLAELFDRLRKLAKLFDENGVKMAVGTDFGGQWLVPGQSLHHEFDLLAGSGIPPLHILRMATLDAARYLKREATMGTVEAGKAADLVLLDANPVESADNLHRISGVVRAGRYYDKAALDAIRERVATALQ